MALDYSKLSDEELQAIANDDYTKLSDRTLRLLSRDKTAPKPAQQPQETALQSFGRGTASLADSALNALTGTLDYGAYALARAAGRSPQQAAQETTSPKDVVGRAFGVTGTPGYENAPLRQLGTAIGNVATENVIQPVSQATGIAEQDVGNMLNSLAIGVAPVAGRATAATGRAVKSAAQVPVDVAKGAVGRATGYIAKPGEAPVGYQVPSSRIPLGETFIPAAEMAQLRQGIPISEASVRPIRELAPAPIMALSGGEIPIAGQAARAYGERIGETYRNPLTAAADIGSMFLTGGVPVLTAGRGALGLAQAGADAYLARKGFTGLTPAETQALNQGINPFYTAPGPVVPAAAAAPIVNTQPLLPYTPAGQTAMPMPGPGRRVNIEGESFNLPYQIDTSRVQAARPQQQPMVGPVAPESIPAPQPSPLTVAETAGKTAEQLAAEQKILDFINSRRGATPEPAPEPKPEPKKRISQEQRIREREAELTPEEKAAQEATAKRIVEKSMGKKSTAESTPQYGSAAEMRKALYGKMPNDELEALVNKTFPSVNTLKEKMNKSKGEQNAAMDEALRQKLEAIKAQGKYRGPKDTSQMMTGDITPRRVGKFENVYPSKEAMEYDTMFSTLGEKQPRFTRHQEGNVIVEVERINYGTAPKDLLRKLNKPTTATRTYDAKTGKQLSGPPKD